MLLDVSATLRPHLDGAVIHRQQVIPGHFLDRLADARLNSTNVREREYMHVASIPVALVESWQRDGFDVYTAPVKEIVARLKRENLGAFLATRKEV